MLYLKYDNSVMRDGIGAQALRIVTLRAIANFFKCGYIHAPMTQIDEHFSDQFQSHDDIQLQLQLVNEFFSFETSKIPESFHKEVSVHELGNRYFLKLLKESFLTRHNILANICLPFSILNRLPQIMNGTPKFMRETQPNFFSNLSPLDVVVHLRMGYGDSVTKNAKGRYLPYDFYVDLMKSVIKRNKIHKDRKIIIHTDLSPTNVKWKVLTSSTRKELVNLGIELNADVFEISGVDLSKIFGLQIDHEIEYRYCDDFFTTLSDMSQARTLIMGRSALSYLAGLMNPNQVIWPNNHGHPKMTWWTSSIEYGVNATKYRLIAG